MARRALYSLLGIITVGLGCGLFIHSGMGSDAVTALNAGISLKSGIGLGTVSLMMNLFYLLFPLFLGRKYIHIGTIMSLFIPGYVIQYTSAFLSLRFPPSSLFIQLLWLFAGILLISLGISIYQTADLGVGSADSLSLLIHDYTHITYALCRILTDGFTALLAFLMGGPIGIGTLICAFCLGPFIQFFNVHISKKLLA